MNRNITFYNLLTAFQNFASCRCAVVLRRLEQILEGGSNLTIDTLLSHLKALAANYNITFIGTIRKNKRELPLEFTTLAHSPQCTSMYGYREKNIAVIRLFKSSKSRGSRGFINQILDVHKRKSRSDHSIAPLRPIHLPRNLWFYHFLTIVNKGSTIKHIWCFLVFLGIETGRNQFSIEIPKREAKNAQEFLFC